MSEMKKVVLYSSKTGFSEQYARWIAEELQCEALSMEKRNLSEFSSYDVIIFGGGIYAGQIRGLKKIKQNLEQWKGKQVIVFATGAAPAIPEEIAKVKQANISETPNLTFFYFQSGINYEKMGGFDRFLMKMFNAMIKRQKNVTEAEQNMAKAIEKSYNHSKREWIEPLVRHVQLLKS